MTTLRKTAATTVAAFALFAAGTLAPTSQAEANNGQFFAGVVTGLVTANIVASQKTYPAPVTVYTTPQQCWVQQQVKYDLYGNPFVQNVQYCQ